MDSLPAAPMGHSSWRELYFATVPYWSPPIAIGVAVFPVFYGLQVKSALQKRVEIPSLSLRAVVKGASQAAPILATQVVMQMLIEHGLRASAQRCGVSEETTQNFAFTLGSSMVVGAASVAPLVAVNGKTMTPPLSVRESIESLTWSKGRAIIGRETCFFTGVSASGPFSRHVQEHFGESQPVKYGAAFMAGASGSFFGHTFDTRLTCLQAEVKIENFYQLMRGCVVRTFSGGAFTVIYVIFKDTLQGK